MTGQSGVTSAESSAKPRRGFGPLIMLLGLVGTAISAYLVYAHYQHVDMMCLPGMECDEVLSSDYAQIWGVPLAMLGLVMYVVVTVLGYLLWRGPARWRAVTALCVYAVTLSATLFSLYLYYLETFKIRGFCTWCVASSIVVFGLLALTSVNLSSLADRSDERNGHENRSRASA